MSDKTFSKTDDKVIDYILIFVIVALVIVILGLLVGTSDEFKNMARELFNGGRSDSNLSELQRIVVPEFNKEIIIVMDSENKNEILNKIFGPPQETPRRPQMTSKRPSQGNSMNFRQRPSNKPFEQFNSKIRRIG